MVIPINSNWDHHILTFNITSHSHWIGHLITCSPFGSQTKPISTTQSENTCPTRVQASFERLVLDLLLSLRVKGLDWDLELLRFMCASHTHIIRGSTLRWHINKTVHTFSRSKGTQRLSYIFIGWMPRICFNAKVGMGKLHPPVENWYREGWQNW